MPQIDVAREVLLDPIVAGEAFVVLRRQEVVNTYGESVQTTTSYDAVGSVTPSGASLQRDEAYQTMANGIRVVTQFRLRGPTRDSVARQWQPDFVLWNGNHYLVTTVNDFAQYGTGFVDADCQSIDLLDGPPPWVPPQVGYERYDDQNNSGLL